MKYVRITVSSSYLFAAWINLCFIPDLCIQDCFIYSLNSVSMKHLINFEIVFECLRSVLYTVQCLPFTLNLIWYQFSRDRQIVSATNTESNEKRPKEFQIYPYCQQNAFVEIGPQVVFFSLPPHCKRRRRLRSFSMNGKLRRYNIFMAKFLRHDISERQSAFIINTSFNINIGIYFMLFWCW